MSAIDNYQTGLETLYLFSEACGKLVHAMGKPVLVNDGKRAYVMLDENKEITFCLDEEYFGNLDYDEDMGFVLLHEALHVAWNHLREQQMDKFDNKKVLTIAQEVVINDSIEKISGLALPDMNGPTGDYMTGPGMFNHDFFGMTTKEAYEFILQNAPEDMDLSDFSNCEITVSDSGAGGSELDDLMNAVMSAIKDEFKDDPGDVAQVAGAGNMDTSDMFDSDGGTGQSSTGGNLSRKSTPEDVEFDFVELLAKIDPRVHTAFGGKGDDNYKNNWTAPRHSMRAYYPEMIIPRIDRIGTDGDNTENSSTDILFATDQSASISQEYVNISMGLLEKTPDDIFTPHMSIWANYCVEYTKEKSAEGWIGGGTNIHSVYNYALDLKETKGIDPYIVVFTDGQYQWREGYYDPQWIKDRWFFVGFTRKDVDIIKGGRYGRGTPVNPDNVYCLDDLWKK